ncbi:MAG: glucan biosynthesis protein, partial [Rhodospirillales bacterium]|nr:glucan biosynthesis protein [Rhodospirillales bacterium]
RNAASPWQPAPEVSAAILDRIDYDAYQQIRYRPRMSLMLDGRNRLPVQLFHLGKFSREPVKLILGALRRQPPRQIAGNDGARRFSHGIDTVKHAARDKEAAG